MQKYLTKSLVKKSLVKSLLLKNTSSGGWSGKPADWDDIRKDCPANSIALYAGELGSNYIIKDGRLTWANPNIYLQSTDDGDTYIDSGLKSQTFDKIECDFQRVSNGISCFFGGRQASENNETDWRYMTDANRYKFVNGSTTYYAYKPSDFKKHKMVYENGSIFLDGTEILSNIQQTSFEGTRNIYLFANNDNGSVQTAAKKACKLYNVKFYVDGTLVRHFVPVPSGLVIGDFTCPSDGMFDIVEQQFYANASTGTFTYGKDSVTNDYDNLGFTATCTGGYNVFIDGTQYGSTYASGTQCSITWSTSGITTGDSITTPSALKAHKIWIEPATEGNNITAFHCDRVAQSGTEQQGVLWGHLNISNSIDLSKGFNYTEYYNNLMEALTCKGNKLTLLGCDYCFYNAESLEFVPTKIDYSRVSDMTNYITNASELGKTNINANSTTLTKLGAYGDGTHFIGNIKNVRVSSEAPFNNATAPQIDVSYTGMDMQALVNLFNSLPLNVKYEVVGAVDITDGVASGFASNKYLSVNINAPLPSNKIEFYTKVTTADSWPSYGYVLRYKVLSGSIKSGIGITGSSTIGWLLGADSDNNNVFIRNYGITVSANTTYYLKGKIENNIATLYYNTTGFDNAMTTIGSKDLSTLPIAIETDILTYGGSENSWTNGSIDLSNTYVMVNGAKWFDAATSMTKTCSVVGCTGTADLTQDDKDIALNKGWSLTLS